IDNSVDGTRCSCRVKRAKYEMASFSGFNRNRNGLEIAHLSDKDDVWILPERGLEGGFEGFRMGRDLPLIDETLLVLVDKLDRILDRDEVICAVLIDNVDETCKGR